MTTSRVSTEPAAPSPEETTVERRNLAWRRFRRNRGAVVGACILAIWVLLAITAPVVAPYPPNKIDFIGRTAPSAQHLFGTDRLGRDVLSRVLFGARISLAVGVISVAIGLVTGTAIGLIAGYFGGWVESVLMRFVDALLAFPGILLALVVIAALGPSLPNVMVAVGVSTIPQYARLARSRVLSVRKMPFVEAAVGLGGSSPRVIVRHILPNVVASLVVLSTLQVGNAILVGSGLSFLGMGAQPPTPEWGLMTAQGRSYLDQAWWVSTFPGLAILSSVVAINLMGDGLREALDPHVSLE